MREGFVSAHRGGEKSRRPDQLRQGVRVTKRRSPKPRDSRGENAGRTRTAASSGVAGSARLTITYPVEFKAAVEIVGPDYAKLLTKARESTEALCNQSAGPGT